MSATGLRRTTAAYDTCYASETERDDRLTMNETYRTFDQNLRQVHHEKRAGIVVQ